MKFYSNFLIAFIVLISTSGLFSFKGKTQPYSISFQTDKGPQDQLAENPYHDLRTKAITVTPEQLKLKLNKGSDLYGIVMDWNMGEAIVTVVSFKTGDASVYLSTGQAFIGGYTHQDVVTAANAFISSGEKYLDKALKTSDTGPATSGKVDFYFLTGKCKYYLDEDFASIENGQSDLTDLFMAANLVITAYREMTESE